jgi:hypothetical protein
MMSCSMAAMISDCVEAAFSGTRGERLWVRAADEAFIEGTEVTREDEGSLVRLCAPAGQPDRRTEAIVRTVYCAVYIAYNISVVAFSGCCSNRLIRGAMARRKLSQVNGQDVVFGT